jgi:hypothetical protein
VSWRANATPTVGGENAPTGPPMARLVARNVCCCRDHATASVANTVTVNIDFDFPKAQGEYKNPYAPSVDYQLFVWDPAQGGSSTGTFTFSTSPRFRPFNGAFSSLTGVSLVAKNTAGQFTSSTGTYLYTGSLGAKVGRVQLEFTGVSSRSDKLDFVVAVYKLTEAEGNLATTAARAAHYSFKTARSSPALLPIVGTSNPDMYFAADNYSPGTDGRLVQNLTVVVVGGAGVELSTPVQSSGGSSADRTRYDSVTRAMTGIWDVSPAVVPVTGGGAAAGRAGAPFVYRVRLARNQNGATTPTGVDVTVSPGPFYSVTPGGTAETYHEAVVLSAGQTATLTFDGQAGTVGTSYATSYMQLYRLNLPRSWYAARFSMSSRALDGSSANIDGAIDAQAQVPQATAPQTFPTGIGSFSTMSADPTVRGAYYVGNTAISSFSSDTPLGSVGNRNWLSSSGAEPAAHNGLTTNYPLFNGYLVDQQPVYVLVCRHASCAATVTSAPRQIEVKVHFDEAKEFKADCYASSDCVTKDGKHPASETASQFSANGDANRFDTCMLLPSAADPVIPEARCIECFSQCDCNPGQFCYRYTGVESINSIPIVVHEESRRRIGVCMNKNQNGTILNMPCRRPKDITLNTAALSDGSLVTVTPGTEVVAQGQAGPIVCGAAVYINGSYNTNTRLNYTGQPLRYLWAGICNIDGRCTECEMGAASLSSQCRNEQTCLDGFWHRTLSVDQTIRTFQNDTRAGTLLAIVFILLFLSLLGCIVCCRTRGAGKRTTPTGGKEELKSTTASAYP